MTPPKYLMKLFLSRKNDGCRMRAVGLCVEEMEKVLSRMYTIDHNLYITKDKPTTNAQEIANVHH
jgi:hypothetical protein